MKTRYSVLLATVVFLGFSVPAAAHPCEDPDDDHKHCKDRGGGGGSDGDRTNFLTFSPPIPGNSGNDKWAQGSQNEVVTAEAPDN